MTKKRSPRGYDDEDDYGDSSEDIRNSSCLVRCFACLFITQRPKRGENNELSPSNKSKKKLQYRETPSKVAPPKIVKPKHKIGA